MLQISHQKVHFKQVAFKILRNYLLAFPLKMFIIRKLQYYAGINILNV